MQITSKALMYQQINLGRFGNYPLFWNTLEEVERSGFTGEVSIRSRQTSNPVRLYHIPAEQLRIQVDALPPLHRNGGLIFSEAPPDRYRTLQGEWDGHNLYYSFFPAPMRIALEAGGHQINGLAARLLLRRYIDPGDVDWLDELTLDFPGHVIEFSGFRVRCGNLQRRMLVWEVRLY